MTAPAIGASSIMGIAFEQLAAPVQSAPATATTGGTIAAGVYRIVVTALNANGETLPSNEQSITTTGSTSTITVNWATVAGATGYKVYVTTAGGATLTETLQTTVGAVITATITAIAAGTALPTQNTASSSGTYAAPTKYLPFLSESLTFQQDTQWRRPIRNTAAVIGAIPGDSHIEGDITFEALSDVIIYFLAATRCSVTKTGTGPFTYTFTPTSAAIPTETMSITIVRNGQVFGYTGCVVSSFRITVDNEVLQMSVSILGRDEASQGPVTATWPVSTPFGAGQYNLQVPTGSPVTDSDSFEFSVDDNGTPNYRLQSTTRGPAFINFGESAAQLTLNRDFITRADYDNFKALTAQSVTLAATKGASESVTLLMPAAVKDTYETQIGGEGDLIRASITYQGVIDGTGKHYLITVVTPTENMLN